MSVIIDGTTGITTPGLTNTGTETILNLTTTGNTILGDATTDTLNVGAGGLVKDASGNVGIGTASPNYKLTIYDASIPRIQLTNSTSGTATSDGYVIYTSGTAAYFLNREADSTYFGNNNTVQATLDSNGRLGIGTTSPGATVDVNGSIRSVASGGIPIIYFNNGTTQHSISNSSGAMPFAIDGTEKMRLDSSGNLGIGTASPSSSNKLQVAGDIAVSWDASKFIGMKYENGASYKMGLMLNTTTRECKVWSQSSDSDDKITFYTGSTPSERMRIDTSGRVFIGDTAAPSGAGNTQFYVKNTTADYVMFAANSNASPAGNFIKYSSAAPNNTGNEFLTCADSSANRIIFRSNGGIANYSGNNVNLSDAREKTNIELAGNYLDKICSIPVKTFNYIDQNLEQDGGLTLGVIAQEVQAVAPELVMESNWAAKDEPEKMRLSIYQTDLQYALMKAIQELKAEFDAYKATHP